MFADRVMNWCMSYISYFTFSLLIGRVNGFVSASSSEIVENDSILLESVSPLKKALQQAFVSSFDALRTSRDLVALKDAVEYDDDVGVDFHPTRSNNNFRRKLWVDDFFEGMKYVIPTEEVSISFPGFGVDLNPFNMTVTPSDVLLHDLSSNGFKLSFHTAVFAETHDDVDEKMTIAFDVSDVVIETFLAAPIDERLVAKFKLGTILPDEEVVPCMAWKAYEMDIDNITFAIGSYSEPQYTGTVSIMERLLVSALLSELSTEKTGKVDQDFVRSAVRPMTDVLVDQFIDEYNCDQILNSATYLDFRDFFLPPEEAKTLGGSGSAPYGDVGKLTYKMLNEILGMEDEEGNMGLNEFFPRNITFPNQLWLMDPAEVPDVVRSFLEASEIRSISMEMIDARFDNLNTVTPPVELFKPTNNAHIITNSFRLGPVPGRPVSGGIGLRVNIDAAEGSIFAMTNEVHLTMSVDYVEIVTEILATVSSAGLLQFPFESLLELPCWASLIPITKDADRGMNLESYNASMENLDFLFTCSTCEKSKNFTSAINEVLDLFEEEELRDVVKARIDDVINEVMLTDSIRGLLNDILAQSRQLCPHHPKYNESVVFSVGFPEEIPKLSRKSLETIWFLFSLAVQVSIMSLSTLLLIGNDDDQRPDPLYGQNSLFVPDNVELVDFEVLASGEIGGGDELDIGGFIKLGIGFINDYFSDEPICPESVGLNAARKLEGKSTAKNSTKSKNKDLLKMNELLGVEDGVFTYDPDFEYTFEGEILRFTELRLYGLDSFSKVNLLDVIAPQTFRNIVEMNHFRLEVDASIRKVGSDPSKTGLLPPLTFGFDFEDIKTAFSMLVAIDKDKIGNLTLGQMIRLETLIPCMGSVFHDVEVTEMFVDVSSIKFMEITGFNSSDVAAASDMVQERLPQVVNKTLVASIPVFFNQVFRALLNNVLDLVQFEAKRLCVLHYEPSEEGFIDFRALLLNPDKSRMLGGSGRMPYGDLIYQMMEMVQETLALDPDSGLSGLNDLLFPPTCEGEAQFSLPGEIFAMKDSFSFANMNIGYDFRVSDLLFDNVDTIGSPMALFNLTKNEAYRINHTGSIGVGEKPLRFKIGLYLDISVNGEDAVKNEFDLSLDVSSATLILNSVVKVIEQRFMEFPLRDLAFYHCWLAMLPFNPLSADGQRIDETDVGFSISKLAMMLKKLDVEIDCRNCTSSGLEEMAEMLQRPGASSDLTAATNKLLDFLMSNLSERFIHDQVDRFLADAAMRCPHSPTYNPNPENVRYERAEMIDYVTPLNELYYFMLLIAVCLLVTAAFVIYQRVVNRRRHEKWLHELSSRDYHLYKENERQYEELDAQINANTTSLFLSPEIPLFVRIAIPIVILGNIGFFISGHINLGATSNVYLTFLNEMIKVKDVYQMSVGRSTLDLWQLGSRSAATLLFIVSVFWPYVKQLISLVAWFLPPRICSTSTRGDIYLWLDYLAKWSMVDVMAMITSLCGLRISVALPETSFMPDKLLGMDVWVIPKWGLYANMLAQLISQFSSHYIIHYHRNVIHLATLAYKKKQKPKMVCTPCCSSVTDQSASVNGSDQSQSTKQATPMEEREEALSSFQFIRPHRAESSLLTPRWYVGPLMIIGGLLTIALLIASTLLPSIAFETYGVFAIAEKLRMGKDVDTEDAIYEYSVIDIIKLYLEQVKFLGNIDDTLGISSFWVLLLLTVLFVPVAQVICLQCIWFIPMTALRRHRMLILNEILQAWEYSEIFLFSIVIEVWQFEGISRHLINGYCDILEGPMVELNKYGILADRDTQCFRRIGLLRVGSYIMFAAVLLLYLMNTFVTKAAEQWLREYEGIDFICREQANDLEECKGDDSKDRELTRFPILFTDTFRWCLYSREDDA